MPTTPLPGMGATMRTRMASMAMARSSASAAILLTLMPGAGQELVHGDDRAGADLHHLAVDAEVRELRAQLLGGDEEGVLVQLAALLLVALEHVERRQGEALAVAHELERPSAFFVGLGGALGSTMSGMRASAVVAGAGAGAAAAALLLAAALARAASATAGAAALAAAASVAAGAAGAAMAGGRPAR